MPDSLSRSFPRIFTSLSLKAFGFTRLALPKLIYKPNRTIIMRFSSKLSLLAVVATASTVVHASPMTNVASPVDAKDDALMARSLPGGYKQGSI